jgi:CelD/BcsL family acetyltransferase involved in cellulose biosynthesis
MEQSVFDVYEMDPIRDPRWAVLVDRHPRASVFHSPNWLRALRTVYGYEPVAISTSAPGSDLTNGLVFCEVNSWLTGRRLISLPFSDHCEPLIDRSDNLDGMLQHLERRVDQERWKQIEIRPVALEPSSNTNLDRRANYSFHRLDLRPSKEKLLQNCHKTSVQRKLRRAVREQLKYEEGTSADLLQKFYRLLVMTRRRHHLPPQPLDWFRALIVAFGNDLRIRVASKDDVAVASILTLSHKNSIVYKYGASDAAFNNLGGMVFLLWKTIEEAKEAGFEELDLGRSDTNNPGLITFKEHWGTVGTSLSYWSYPHRTGGHPTGDKKSLARRLVSVMPNIALEAAGKLLYKHFG